MGGGLIASSRGKNKNTNASTNNRRFSLLTSLNTKNVAMSRSKRALNSNVTIQMSLKHPRIFKTLLSLLDFMSLFRVMQTRRDYRWDLDKRGYQPEKYWVHKVIRKRLKQIFLGEGGLRSTVERRNFWIYTSKLTKLRDE